MGRREEAEHALNTRMLLAGVPQDLLLALMCWQIA